MMESKEEKYKKQNQDIPVEHFTDYIENFYKMNLLKATAKVSKAGAGIFSSFCFFIILVLVLVLSSIGLSLWIGSLLNNNVTGFFLVALFFLIVFIVLLLLRKKVLLPFFKNLIIRNIYD